MEMNLPGPIIGLPISLLWENRSTDKMKTPEENRVSPSVLVESRNGMATFENNVTVSNTEISAHVKSERPMDDQCLALKKVLMDQEVEENLADKLVSKVKGIVTKGSVREEWRRQAERVLLAVLGEPDTIRMRADGKPTVVILIGPTGVGKTTTLAKIAAEFSLNRGKKVGLITADTYRIAAVEQLKTYAEILNLPVSVVYSPSEINESIRKYHDMDLILVDTAGRSHKNRPQFDELKTLLKSAVPDEIYLVLSGNMSRIACKEILQHYSFIEKYKLLFTKLDEAMVPGIIINTRLWTGKPISYTTAGQSVPDDIDVADPKALASGILGNMI
jgi:flagellar biosynthesis protein FlhF